MSAATLTPTHLKYLAASRKCILISILLVFLTFPQATHEFNFQFSDDENDDKSKQMLKRKAVEKKFKFRKIERIYDDSGNDDFEDEQDSTAPDSAAADSSMQNENEEFLFQRARKARHPLNAHEKGNQRKSTEDISKEKTETTSFLGSIYNAVFSKESAERQNDNEHESSEIVEKSKSNSIIDWLTWLGEKSGKIKTKPPPEQEESESFLSYFNRWPFNSFFPIGQPDKPIRIPHRSTRRAKSSSDAYIESNEEAESVLSQEHFNTLLHRLPGFVINAADVNDIDCRQQIQIFYRQLRGNKLWTLQMLDATGKITSGLLRGNINQFGDFDLCQQVKTLVKVTPEKNMRIRGKYCLAHIETQTAVEELKLAVHMVHGRGLLNSHLGNPSHFVPRYSVANWGICIPHMCSAKVVQEMLQNNLSPYNNTGVEFHVEVNDNDCYMRQSRKYTKLLKKDGKFGIACISIFSLMLLVLASLIYEHWIIIAIFIKNLMKKYKANNEGEVIEPEAEVQVDNTSTSQYEPKEESNLNDGDVNEDFENVVMENENTSLKFLALSIFKSFSPKRTFAELISQDRFDVEFPIFHILKLGATFMLYICLKYLMIGHLPITNRDKLVRSLDQSFSILFRAPLIYTDVLLLISGFLSAYQLSIEMEQKTYIQLLKRVAAKISRYLPTVYLVLFFQTWILPYLGTGPLWTNLIGENSRVCEQQMWRNLFGVQNAIDFEETCSPMTIQLGLEIQLYFLCPLIVWLYYTDADAGFFAYGAIHALSVAARYSRTQREHLSMTLFHGMNVSKFYRTANILYSSPISRATPYLLGIGCAILYRSQEGTLDIAPELIPIGWFLTALSIFWCFWSPSPGMHSDYIYTSSDAASYSAWSPLILGLALCWIILMLPKKENSFVQFLRSTRPILFLSRIAFPMQLMVYVVVISSTASVKESLKYHLTDLINLKEIGIIVVLATLLAFIIDIPSKNIRHLLINRILVERPQHEQEPTSGTEPSESGEDRSEHTTCDTPEPPDTIWSSDANEENKYLERQGSSDAINNEAVRESENILETEPELDNEKVEIEVEEEEEDEDADAEEENEIKEEDEVKRRPATPTTTKEESVFTRRRRPISDD